MSPSLSAESNTSVQRSTSSQASDKARAVKAPAYMKSADDQSNQSSEQPTVATLFWRIVFTQQGFTIQVTNNFGGHFLTWVTVPDEEKREEIFRIPEGYLSALATLGRTENFVNREVVEKRSVPMLFAAYGDARRHALETMGLPPAQEWHPDAKPARTPSYFNRSFFKGVMLFCVIAAVVITVLSLAAPRP